MPRRHQRDSTKTKHNEIQMDKKLHSEQFRTKKQNVFDSGSRSELSFTVQKDTEVIHREVKGRTKINCYLKEKQSEFSETRRLKDWAKKLSEFVKRRGATSCGV